MNILPLELRENRDYQRDLLTAFENSTRNHNNNKNRIDKNKHSCKVGDLVYVNNGNKLNRHD